MAIIVNGGDARSTSLIAIKKAREGNIDEAREMLKDANNAIARAHEAQTGLIQAEARGDKVEMSLLMVHAQDHIMNAMTIRDLAEEIVEILAEKKF